MGVGVGGDAAVDTSSAELDGRLRRNSGESQPNSQGATRVACLQSQLVAPDAAGGGEGTPKAPWVRAPANVPCGG